LISVLLILSIFLAHLFVNRVVQYSQLNSVNCVARRFGQAPGLSLQAGAIARRLPFSLPAKGRGRTSGTLPVVMIAAPRAFLQRLIASYGSGFCLLLLSCYGGLKGPVFQMTTSALLPYFKNIGITGQRYQSMTTVASTPWAMKSLLGLMSDAVPLFGYHKRPYILMASAFGVIALITLAAVEMSEATAPVAALLLMFVSLQLATVDLLVEGTYAALMATMPETGSDVVTFVWALYMIGSFVGSTLAGPIADHFNARTIFWVCLPLCLQIIPMSSFLPEEKLPPDRRGVRMDKVREHPKVFLLAVAMTTGAMTLAAVALFEGSNAQSVVSVFISVLLCILACLWLPPMLARSNLYMFLASVRSVCAHLCVSFPFMWNVWHRAATNL
jgi:MFS family permease